VGVNKASTATVDTAPRSAIAVPTSIDENGLPRPNFLKDGGTGLWSWLSTLDHKRIGVMYLIMVMTMFFVGGLYAMLIRI